MNSQILILALLCVAQLAFSSPMPEHPETTKFVNPASALRARTRRSVAPVSSVVVPKTPEVESAIHSLSQDTKGSPSTNANGKTTDDLDGANTFILPVPVIGGGFGYPGPGYGYGGGYGGYGLGWGR